MRTEVPTRSTAVTACFWFVVVIILLAGLWPFQFRPPNQVNQDRENGLVFGKRGIAYARDLNWRSTQPAGFTMETWLKSAGPVTSHLANVVCLTRTSSCSEFLLSQWRSEPLLVARFSDANGTSRQRKMGVADALPAGRWAYVVITSGTDGMQMYVNGQLREKSSLRLAIEDNDEMLVLGNDAIGVEPWQGAIAAIAIYARSLSAEEIRQRYTAWLQSGSPQSPQKNAIWFDFTGLRPAQLSLVEPREGTVYVPSKFVPPHRMFLEWDIRFDRNGTSDILLNFFGFIPFGFLACLMLNRRNWLAAAIWTVLAGIALSAVIEITQAFMPGRDSSCVDLLFNSLGTVAGAALWVAVSRVRSVRSEMTTE